MYDYAPFMKRKYAALTQKYRDSSLQYFPKQSRQHLIIQGIINRKGQETNHYNDYLLFSPLFLSDPDRVFAYIILIIKKERQRKREKDG
jgi:hypothetical protein